MRVAIIGLGAIAQKAYVPVLMAREGVTPVLVTRNPHTLASVGDAHRVQDRFGSVDAAIASGLDAATVHTPSATHPAVVADLLRAGVPVLVDKPLATEHASARELVALATGLGVSLMVGFNRRYAPAYQALADWPDRDVVTLHKHRAAAPGPARAMVFDDFIHVIDTLRFLVPSATTDLVISSSSIIDGSCRRLAIQYTGAGRLAVGVMSWTAGLTHEVLDVIGNGRRRQVTDLSDVVDFDAQERFSRRDGWAPVTRLRGFEAMCTEFLGAVREGRRLDAADALATHEVCERVVRAAEVRRRCSPAWGATMSLRSSVRPGGPAPASASDGGLGLGVGGVGRHLDHGAHLAVDLHGHLDGVVDQEAGSASGNALPRQGSVVAQARPQLLGDVRGERREHAAPAARPPRAARRRRRTRGEVVVQLGDPGDRRC